MRLPGPPVRFDCTAQSTTERVEGYMREAIYAGQFKPRERLVEQTLAATLKCSRGPVREAIMRLEREGLLITIPRRGTFVPDMTPEAIEVVFRMRGKLEGLCALYARKRLTPVIEQKLLSILEDMRAAATKSDEIGFFESDMSLHANIRSYADCPQLEHTLLRVMNSQGFLIARTFSSLLSFQARLKHHEEYLHIAINSLPPNLESDMELHFSSLYNEIFGGIPHRSLIACL